LPLKAFKVTSGLLGFRALELVAAGIEFLVCVDASGSTSPAKKTEFAIEIVQTSIAIATITMADDVTADLVNDRFHYENDSQ
jgi:hypothetical protein